MDATEPVATAMVSGVTSALGTVIDWIGTVLTAITGGSLSSLWPLLAVGIAISIVMLVVAIVKRFAWGA